jgi:hypothetical protein
MFSKRAKLILVASAGCSLLLARPPGCFALPVDMGLAGSQYWTVLQTGGGTITLAQPVATTSKKKKKKTSTAVTTASRVAIMGNVGLAQGGAIVDSGNQFQGDLYLSDNASAQFSGTYANNSPVTGMVRMSNGSTILPSTGYSFNNTASALQPMMDRVRLDAIAASAAASSLSPTSTLSSISLGSSKKSKGGASLTLNPGIYNLTDLLLTRATLTLSGTGSFVFNISSSFALKSAQVLLANGATASDVLFNYTGTSDVTLSNAGKKTSGSVLSGIILAMNANINLAQGLVVGEIITGGNISMGAGSLIQSALPNIAPPFGTELTPTVPEHTSTIFLTFIALGLLVGSRFLRACSLSLAALSRPRRAVSG